MQISIIAAVTDNLALGRNGDMLFHISADLKRFKALTIGKPVIMGRKTFESLPGGALSGRRNIVITRNTQYKAEGVETYASLEQALEACRDCTEAMVIGGGQIYRQALPLASRLILTQIHTTVEDADTFFPAWTYDDWKVAPVNDTDATGINPSPLLTDPRSGIPFNYLTLQRRRP